MNFDERVDAVCQLGFSDREARFLTTVMLHAGVCVPRQFATLSGTAYGHTVNAFFDRLVERRVAVVCGCQHNRAELYHVRQHALYRAIGESHSRYRRPVSTRQAIERLARLDALVTSPTVIWFSSEAERVAFCRLMVPSLATEQLPHVTVGAGPAARLRLFPDDVLMGVEPNGRTVFAWLVGPDLLGDWSKLQGCVQRHRDLLRALPGWTLRLVFRRDAAKCRDMVEERVRRELTMRLAPRTLGELEWYFRERRETENPKARRTSDERFARCSRAFRTSAWELLYRRWLTDGDSVFQQLDTTPIRDALERGSGRIEIQVLPFSYRHLLPLAALNGSARSRVEQRAQRARGPQPSNGHRARTRYPAGGTGLGFTGLW